jgi:hypothetical protein
VVERDEKHSKILDDGCYLLAKAHQVS